MRIDPALLGFVMRAVPAAVLLASATPIATPLAAQEATANRRVFLFCQAEEVFGRGIKPNFYLSEMFEDIPNAHRDYAKAFKAAVKAAYPQSQPFDEYCFGDLSEEGLRAKLTTAQQAAGRNIILTKWRGEGVLAATPAPKPAKPAGIVISGQAEADAHAKKVAAELLVQQQERARHQARIIALNKDNEAEYKKAVVKAIERVRALQKKGPSQ